MCELPRRARASRTLRVEKMGGGKAGWSCGAVGRCCENAAFPVGKAGKAGFEKEQGRFWLEVIIWLPF